MSLRRLRAPLSRYQLSCIAFYQTPFHLESTLNVKQENIAVSQRQSGHHSRTGKTFWYTGVGLFAAGLYYVLVNGPSKSARTSDTEPLSPLHFTLLTLTASTSCTPYTKLLTLSLPAHLIPDEAARCIAPIFSIYIKDSDIQIERPYTPLGGIDAQGRMRFWVKRYEGGEVGRWLHERKVGDVVEVRGPVRTWDWQDGMWDEIVMISGGTGITPFYQLLLMVFSGEALPRTRFTLLHSSPTPSDLPPEEILEPLQTFAQAYPNMFSLRVFVDSAESQRPRKHLPRLNVGRIGHKAVDAALAHLAPREMWWRWWFRGRSLEPKLGGQRILFLVCGPESMIAAIAGPRGRNRSQGRAGGVLGEMGFESRQVWTL